MNKKYMSMFLGALMIMSASSVFAKEHDGKDGKRAMREMMRMNNYMAEDCTVVFPNVLGGQMDVFEDKVEYFMATSSFWEKCVQLDLDKGQNVNITFIAFTESESPNARETVRAVKAGKNFTEEFTDYVEDVQEYTGVYERPERFTHLQVPASVSSNKKLMREVKDVNKHYKAKSDMPKVNVNVKFAKATQPDHIGAVKVSSPMAKKTMPMQPLQPAKAMPQVVK